MLVARAAAAVPACTAGDIEGIDPGCPAQGPCTITRDIEVAGRCTLDFGTRAVSLGEGRRIVVGDELVFKAASFTMQPGAFIDGRGEETEEVGARVLLRTTGDVVLQQRAATRARIDVSAVPQPGAIDIRAGGNVTLRGPLTAKRGTTRPDDYGSGGYIAIKAGGTADAG